MCATACTPGVADAVNSATPAEVRAAIDTELGHYWTAASRWARARPEGEHTAFVVHAGLSAAPYLIRLHEWSEATVLLRGALIRDSSPAVAFAAAAHLRRIALNASTPELSATLARAIASVEPVEAERLMRTALDQAIDGEPSTASLVAGDLIILLRTQGRLQEALELSARRSTYAQQTGAGPWTQLADRIVHLQVLRQLGRSEEVLTEVHDMLEVMRTLPDHVGDDETVVPWNTREVILNTGVYAAITLRRWDDALSLAEEAVASKEQRGASDLEVASAQYSTAKPLLALGRLDDAERVLLTCQEIYENANDLQRLSRVLTVRSEIASARAQFRDAAHLQRSALRVGYVSPIPTDIAMGHFNLANYLWLGTDSASDPVAHRLAAAVLFQLIGRVTELERTTRVLAEELRHDPDVPLPATVSEVATRVELVEGVRFSELVAALTAEVDVPDRILDEVIQNARSLPPDDVDGLQQHLDRWEPSIAAVVAAVGGDPDAAQAMDGLLDQLAETTDWRALAAAVRRILAGERDPEQLLAGLDPIDSAIVRRTLDALASQQVRMFAAVVSEAIAGDREAADAVDRQLDAWAEMTELANLATAIRRVVAGDRDPENLLTGLDDDGVEIVQAILAQLR